ncbi:probable G-protein coupled receptor Mth-like 1 [Hyalella azteca]|uniref:Probable G-protein coupled receptor Mth-like 1 n=1 Tax=Hyalella azteca TaxID=294128 RepID=A0A979FXG5_HYAAZ|nr:probable G-protein coupled receptor Mth-like 1 [Hyalella azteca]
MAAIKILTVENSQESFKRAVYPVCLLTVENSQESFKRAVYPVCLLVSAGFLLLTLLAYCVVKELRADQLSKCFMCSVGMLACAQIIMVAGMWGRDDLMESTMCVIIASLSHFSFLSAFLWLNVICIMIFSSLWWSGLMSSNKMQVVRLRWKCLWSGLMSSNKMQVVRLRWKCLYSFGVAGFIAGLALLRHALPTMQGSVLPAPHFGAVSCWIFFDFVNIMQGVLIFVVFVCRPSVLRLLTRALCGAQCSSRCFAPVEEKDRNDTEVAPCNTVV